MMWFDKADSRALFIDRREETVKAERGPQSKGHKDKVIAPDVLADFTDMPFPDGSFDLVVFDPPHLTTKHGTTGVLSQTYGVLFPGWEEMLAGGFKECFRVLRDRGTLIFKWCEVEIPLYRVLALTPEKPLFGHQSGRKAQTHWITFLKQNTKDLASERSEDC
jgi:SAM-dependent methyltransferase